MRRNTFLVRLAASPAWAVAVGVATIVGAAGTVAAVIYFRSPSSAAPVDSPIPAASPTGKSPNSNAAPTSLTVGTCFDAGVAAVPCTAGHYYELIVRPNEPCSNSAVVAYLGGRDGLDVVLPTPKMLRVSGGQRVCVLADPAPPAFASGRNALRTSDAGRWRRCVDGRVTDEIVDCSVPHTGEYLNVPGKPAPDASACAAAAETYLGVALDRVSGQLAVVVIPAVGASDGAPHCLVHVLGNEVLTDTIRNIGVRALPLSAAD